jgi:hypothetical protein
MFMIAILGHNSLEGLGSDFILEGRYDSV